MALEMDPEVLRKAMEAARVQREWEDRHGIDDPEWAEDGSAERHAGQPTPEQYEELERAKREIYGLDPDTGRSRS